MHLCPDPAELPQEQMVNIPVLAALVERERYLETALDKLFAQSSISEEDMAQLLSLASQTRDEYQRGQLYVGLLHYREELGKLTDGARGCVAAYLAHELRRYLAQEPLEDECRNNLEVMADISRHFADDGVIGLLREVMALGHHHINFYAVTTLLSLGQEVSAQTVQALSDGGIALVQGLGDLLQRKTGKVVQGYKFPVWRGERVDGTPQGSVALVFQKGRLWRVLHERGVFERRI